MPRHHGLHQYGIVVSLRQYLVLGLLVAPALLFLGSTLIWLQARGS